MTSWGRRWAQPNSTSCSCSFCAGKNKQNSAAINLSSTHCLGMASLNPKHLVFLQAGAWLSLGLTFPNSAARMGVVGQRRGWVEGEEDTWAPRFGRTEPSAPNKPHPWFGLNPRPCPRGTERVGEPDPRSRVSTPSPPPLQLLPWGGPQALRVQKMLPATQNWGIFSLFPSEKGSSTHMAPTSSPPQRYSHNGVVV